MENLLPKLYALSCLSLAVAWVVAMIGLRVDRDVQEPPRGFWPRCLLATEVVAISVTIVSIVLVFGVFLWWALLLW